MKSATLPDQPSISPAQCRAARGLLDWSREQLAEASSVALRTIVDFERGARSPRAGTLRSLQSGLEAAGVVFLADDGQGAGVRLRNVA
ncbi:MAG: helix-turn-helix transcriptional regulator [Devosia sp.]